MPGRVKGLEGRHGTHEHMESLLFTAKHTSFTLKIILAPQPLNLILQTVFAKAKARKSSVMCDN